ncbi:MAG: CARDB domain-containing protein [Gemmatimonadales bacterium]
MQTLLRTSVLCLLPALAAAGAAKAQPAAGAHAQINECLLKPLPGVSDLTVCALGFNSAGEITFSVKNRGSVGISMAAPVSLAGGRPVRPADPGQRIRIDLYLADRLIQAVYQPALGGDQTKEVVAKIPSNYPTPRCGESQPLRLVIDPTNQIAEASEANNSKAVTANRPCPDMEVVSITANYNDLKTEFVAEIRIANRGNALARFRYMALTSNSSAIGPLPAADFDKWMEIEPGQTRKFTIGNAFSYSSMYVRVFLDRFSEVAELDESNNFKDKKLP